MTNKNVQTDKKIISGKRLALTKQIQISNARLKWRLNGSFANLTGTAIQKYHQIEIGTYTGDAVIKMSCKYYSYWLKHAKDDNFHRTNSNLELFLDWDEEIYVYICIHNI